MENPFKKPAAVLGARSFCAWLAGLLIASLCGCNHSRPEVKPQSPPVKFTQVTGDCGEVILRHALLYGAKPTATNGLPKLGPEWSYAELQNGVLILLDRDQYDTVELFVLQAFGPPSLGPKNAKDIGNLKGYRFNRQGSSIRYGLGNSNTVVAVAYATGSEARQPAAWLAVPDDRFWKGMYQRHDSDFYR